MKKKLNKIILMGLAMVFLAAGLFFLFCECESLALSLISKPLGIGSIALFIMTYPGELKPMEEAEEDFFN